MSRSCNFRVSETELDSESVLNNIPIIDGTVSLDILTFRTAINKALEATHGILGTGINLDILKYRKSHSVAIIRLNYGDYKMFWQSITLYSMMVSGKKSKFVILSNSALLLGL
ncbi:hypothetical protein AYI68_g3561 [Smittium mucronatum]|uniref:Ribonucleases P/MRP subunit Pop8-like domain-containing protein n=1 Tax=Smittium mucronatum TaxID=133383 RepID=A0A1R0GZM0_9FUNG|nr:hypothetical protein AYI68_g3561 [Smittium mucronatum]